ncbi:MAG TPA: porphobilinogen synthase, partial [Myxococcales bacterium]|nr:porphobilinogen synthase [Myxococcales bacterium]
MTDQLDLPHRPRRNRRNPVIRGFAQESWLTSQHFIYPLFIHDGTGDIPIASMPGCARLDMDGLMREAQGALEDGVGAIVLFPATPESLKTLGAEEAYNPQGLVQRALRRLKVEFPELMTITDVALDPYSSAGHD